MSSHMADEPRAETKINWQVRIKNKTFWITIIPTVLLLAQQVAALCGVTIDVTQAGGQLLAIVDTVFVILVAMGVVNDPTTKGLGDSERALTYEEPR